MTLIERLLVVLASLATILTAMNLAPINRFQDYRSVVGAAAITDQPYIISGTGTVR
jgi:hypothetical protein